MSRRGRLLEARRDLLVARSAYLRADLQCEGIEIGRRLHFVDRSVAFAQSGQGRVLIVGAAVLLVLAGPGRIVKMAGRLLTVWPLVQPLLSALRAASAEVR